MRRAPRQLVERPSGRADAMEWERERDTRDRLEGRGEIKCRRQTI